MGYKQECFGFSVNKYSNCMLWLESDLVGGGNYWGGADCYLLDGLFEINLVREGTNSALQTCGNVPEQCVGHLSWALQTGRNSYPESYPYFEAVTGRSLADANAADMKLYFYCQNIQAEHCRYAGLQPTCCGDQPCSCGDAAGICYEDQEHDTGCASHVDDFWNNDNDEDKCEQTFGECSSHLGQGWWTEDLFDKNCNNAIFNKNREQL